jgi:F-type H+-transporting ATPase subunit gamma
MAGTKVIKQKIKAITSIKKITKTMEMVSFAKMKKSGETLGKISPYINESKSLIEQLRLVSQDEHVLFTQHKKPANKSLVIIFASNKGLCGSFNSNIFKKTRKLVEENPEIRNAICFGKFADKIAKRLGLAIDMSVHDIEKIETYKKLLKTEQSIRQSFLSGEYKSVFVSYTSFVKNGIYQNNALAIYPVPMSLTDAPEVTRPSQITTFEPTTAQLFDTLLPKLITVLLYSFILESRASEYSMRSFAMKRANESAGELLHTLKIKYNRVRQDSITQEIAEISAGASA